MTAQNFCYVAAVTRDSHWWISLLAIVGTLAAPLAPAYAYTITHRSTERHCPEAANANTTVSASAAIAPTKIATDCDRFGACDGRCCSFCHINFGIGLASVVSAVPWVNPPVATYPGFHSPLLVFLHNRPPSIAFTL